MKAVNQSVGRAIRHREDYAAIIFLDHRFTSRGQILSHSIGDIVGFISPSQGLRIWPLSSYGTSIAYVLASALDP
jgi:hypothetical protein